VRPARLYQNLCPVPMRENCPCSAPLPIPAFAPPVYLNRLKLRQDLDILRSRGEQRFRAAILEERVSDRAGLSMKRCSVLALMCESGYFLTIPSFADGVSM
jgi:hypothetical protein